jgi:hypothetical protein
MEIIDFLFGMGDKNHRITAGEEPDQGPAKVNGLSGYSNGYIFNLLNNTVFEAFIFMN